MAITISDGISTVLLDDEMRWIDEFEWHPVEHAESRSVTGKLLLQIGTRTNGGRPITLAAGDGDYGTTVTGLLQLKTWASVAGQELSITIPGRSQIFGRVAFAHGSESPIRTASFVDYNDRLPSDLVRLDRLAFISLE